MEDINNLVSSPLNLVLSEAHTVTNYIMCAELFFLSSGNRKYQPHA